MDKRKPVSVFKSIIWCLIIFCISILCEMIISFVIFWIIGWLQKHIGIIYKLMSNQVIYYIFMTATAADIGRRVAGFLMRCFANSMEKSRNVGKGFLGAGIILAICGLISIVICIMNKTTFLDLSQLFCGGWYIIFGKISDYEDTDVDDDDIDNSDGIREGAFTQKSCFDYSEETILGYADKLCKNSNLVHLTKEEAIYFIKNILIPGEKDGAAIALANFFEFKNKLHAENVEEGFLKTSYFLGVLNSNGIINDDEANRLGEQLVDSFMDEKLKKNKASKMSDSEKSDLPLNVIVQESDFWKKIFADMELPMRVYVLRATIIKEGNTFGVAFQHRQLAYKFAHGPSHDQLEQYFRNVFGENVNVKSFFIDEKGEYITV